MSAADGASQASSHVLRGAICALLGGAAWGFSGTCAQLLLDGFGIPALWVTCVRLAIAAVVFMLIAVVVDGKTLRACLRDVRSVLQIFLFAVFGVVFTQMSYLLAIANTNAGTATVIQQIGLVIIMVVTCVRLRRGPKVREVAGLLFALAGVLIIATQGNPSSLSISPAGLFWGVMCGIGLACYTLLPERVLGKWGSLSVTGLAMLFGGVSSALVVRPWSYDIHVSVEAVAALAALVLVGTFLAYLLYLQGVKDAGPVRASLLCCIEPVSAMVISALWLGTEVSLWDIVGCVLILVMIFLVTGSPKEAEETSPALASGSASEGASAGVLERESPMAPEGETQAARGKSVKAATLPSDDPVFRGRASVLGYYESHPATQDDFAAVLRLLRSTREELVRARLEDEGKKYPSSRRLMNTIKKGLLHVVRDVEGRMIAVFAVTLDLDKNYERGIDGGWVSESCDPGSSHEFSTYAVLRWMCVEPDARQRGVGAFMLDKALGIARLSGRVSLRCDVHPSNEPMCHLLEKYGFSHCGTLEIKDALGRVKRREAFERKV